MIIEYETSKYIKEKAQIEIQDTKNVFLQGKNPYDCLNTYFGIWINNSYLVIATFISGRNIHYEYYLNKNGYTEGYIKKYLENNKDIKIISKNEFRKQLEKINTILEM